jgi:hypothetical protein
MILYADSTTNERWYDDHENFFLLHFYNIKRLYWSRNENISRHGLIKASPYQVRLLIKVIFKADEFVKGGDIETSPHTI